MDDIHFRKVVSTMGKIIVTIDGNVPSKYAHSFNVMKMAQGFSQCGHKTEVVSLLSWPIFKEWFKIKNIHYHYGVSKEIKITLLPVCNKDFYHKTIGAKGFNARAGRYFKKKKPDLVYCRSYLSVIECIKNRIPCIIETHTTLFDHPDLKKVFELSRSEYFLGLVTINKLLAEEYSKRGVPKNKILFEEDGVDVSQYNINDDKLYWRKKLQIPEEKRIVLYSGGLYKEKGIESILKTKKLIKDETILFYIIGGTSEQVAEWTSYVDKNKIKNISFLGFKPNSELPGYHKAADILFMPYDTNMNYQVMDIHSTSPLKLFEYMAAKRPIVTSNIPVIKKIVKNKKEAMLARPNHHADLVDCIYDLLNDDEKADKIVNNAFKLAEKYSWENRCKRILGKTTEITI